MENTLLTEFQSACRAAHEQVQLLQDLYQHLCGPESLAAASIDADADDRLAELRDFEEMLLQKLKEQDLLPKQPDPERESLLELITGVKATVTGEEQPAADERLATEETGLLQHIETMLEHDRNAALEEARRRTRAAIARLSGPATGSGGQG